MSAQDIKDKDKKETAEVKEESGKCKSCCNYDSYGDCDGSGEDEQEHK